MSSDFSLPLVGLLHGASVASGLRLYATVAVLGFLGRTGVLALLAGRGPASTSPDAPNLF